jgi:hypothetical protein
MRTTLALVLICAAPARAGEGVVLGLEAGYGIWNFDHDKVAGQALLGDVLLTQRMKNGFAPALRLGYNVLGHAALEFFFTGSLFLDGEAQGGGAFVGGQLTWYPLALFMEPDRMFDLGLSFGLAPYAIVGHNISPATGMDGMAWPLGLSLEFHPAPWFSIAAVARTILLAYNRFIYHWENKIYAEMKNGSGGSLMTLGIALNFHVPLMQ